MALMERNQAEQATLTGKGSYENGAGQWITHELYDTLPFPTTPITMDFFSNPISGTKSLARTNLKQAGQLPVNQKFRFSAVEFSLINVSAAGVNTDTTIDSAIKVLQQTAWQFIIDGREYDLQFNGASLLPSMIGLSAATIGVSVGRFTAKGEFKLGTKINIGSLTSFGLKVGFDPNVATPLTALSGQSALLQVRLQGELLRKIS